MKLRQVRSCKKVFVSLMENFHTPSPPPVLQNTLKMISACDSRILKKQTSIVIKQYTKMLREIMKWVLFLCIGIFVVDDLLIASICMWILKSSKDKAFHPHLYQDYPRVLASSYKNLVKCAPMSAYILNDHFIFLNKHLKLFTRNF